MATLDRLRLEAQKKSRQKKTVFIFMLHFFVTAYSAYFFHQFSEMVVSLNNGTYQSVGLELDWNYFKAWYLLVIKREPGMVIWWLVSEVAFLIFMVYIWMQPRSRISNVREYKVTDYISIPVPAGNGQHGNKWFASPDDKERLTHTLAYDGSNPMMELEERPGVVLGMERKDGTDYIQYLNTFAHAIILALTGAGKTRRVLLQSICLQLMAGDCILVSDVKGEIFYYTSDYAKKRGYEVIAIDLSNPLKSAHYNFLQPIIDAIAEGRKKQQARIEALKKQMKEEKDDLEKIGAIAKEIEMLKKDYSWTDKAQDYTWDLVAIFAGEQKGEPLWYNGETATMAACILAVCLDAPKECWNLYNVYNFIAYMAQENPVIHKTPLSAYLNQLPDSHPAKMIFMQSQVAAERTRASFYTSALGTLRLFTNPGLAEMSSSSDFKLGDIGTKKMAIYMIIPDEKKTYYPIASVLINQLYIAQVETARRSGGTLPIPTDYDLDEIGNFPPIPVMANLLSVGRSRGIQVNLVIQDYQQLQAKYKDDFETIKSQCGLKVFLKSDNNKTLEDISKTLGEYTVESTSSSTSSSTNLRRQDANISNSSNLSGRKLLFESDIAKIKYPDALVMVTGENPMMIKLPDFSEYHFNHMLGLGDEKHNRELIERKESGRPERHYAALPLWGIWNEYKAILETEAKRMAKKSGIQLEQNSEGE